MSRENFRADPTQRPPPGLQWLLFCWRCFAALVELAKMIGLPWPLNCEMFDFHFLCGAFIYPYWTTFFLETLNSSLQDSLAKYLTNLTKYSCLIDWNKKQKIML